MSFIGEKIKNRAEKLLPKILEDEEKKLGYKLPSVKIVNVNAHIQGNLYHEDYTISLGGVFVDLIVSRKDGSLGKIKKILQSLIENIILFSGWEYREIFLNIERGSPSDFINENEKKITPTEKYSNLIKDILAGKKIYTGSYSLPYSSNEDMVDFIIEYNVKEVSLWKTKNSKHCPYSGVIFVHIDKVLVGFHGTDDWETAKIYDLPSWVDDNFKDNIHNNINMFDNICMDVDY